MMRNSVPVPFDAQNREMFLFRPLDELINSVKDKQGRPSPSVGDDGGRERHV